jgi:hypothetical protein
MSELVTIEEAKLEHDLEWTPWLVFGGRLNLADIDGFNGYEAQPHVIDSLATSIGHEIIKQAKFLYELSKDD